MGRRREARIRKERTQMLWTMAAATAVIVLGAWLFTVARAVSPTLGEHLCPEDARIAADILIVLDHSDEWSSVRRAAVRREIEVIRNSIPRFARVSIHVVEPHTEPGNTERLGVCNPGTAEQIAADARSRQVHEGLVTNEQFALDYQSQFEAIVDSVVTATTEQDRPTSPIIETLRGAVMDTPGTRPTTLYVISDMFQNSDLFSAYRRTDWSLELADSLADVYVQGTTAMNGVEVILLLLSPNDAVSDPDAIRRFWTRFFDRQGAILTRIRRIEG